nr:hypothetical protein [Nitrosomonas nitrosa]
MSNLWVLLAPDTIALIMTGTLPPAHGSLDEVAAVGAISVDTWASLGSQSTRETEA